MGDTHGPRLVVKVKEFAVVTLLHRQTTSRLSSLVSPNTSKSTKARVDSLLRGPHSP